MVTRQAPFSTFPRNPALGRVNRPIYGVLVLRLRILRRYFPREKLARGGACVTWLVTSRRRGDDRLALRRRHLVLLSLAERCPPPPFLNSELLATTACRRPHSHSLPKMDTQPLWQARRAVSACVDKLCVCKQSKCFLLPSPLSSHPSPPPTRLKYVTRLCTQYVRCS